MFHSKKSVATFCGQIIRKARQKAKFFMAHGFSVQDWEALAEALRDHAVSVGSSVLVEGHFGTKHVVEAPISCPDGSSPMIRSVWMVEGGSENLRLVTAHPL